MRWALGDEAQARIDRPSAPGLRQDVLGTASMGSDESDPTRTLASVQSAIEAALPAGDTLTSTVTVQATMTSATRWTPPSTPITSLPDQAVPGLFPVLDGRLPTADDEVAMTASWAQQLAIGLGDEVTVESNGGVSRALRLTGRLAPTAQSPQIVVAPSSLKAPDLAFPAPSFGPSSEGPRVQWYVLGPAPVTWDDVLAINMIGSAVISRAVVSDPPPRSTMAYYDAFPTSVDLKAYAMSGLVGVLVVLESVLLIGPAFAVAARRSQRQVAVLAAVGADRRTLRASVLLVGMLTGLVASTAGVAAGVAIAAVVRAVIQLRAPFAMPDLRVQGWLLFAFAAFGVLVTTAAAWLPARRAARVDVVAALGGRRADAAPSRRLPVLGLSAMVVGGVLTAVGASVGRSPVVMAGVVLLELGVIAASGALVSLVSRLAPRFGLGARLALRDAARHRSRTAPAVAAVLAATAGAMAGGGLPLLQPGARRSHLRAAGGTGHGDGLVPRGANRGRPGDRGRHPCASGDPACDRRSGGPPRRAGHIVDQRRHQPPSFDGTGSGVPALGSRAHPDPRRGARLGVRPPLWPAINLERARVDG